jgi:hypothetical protein
MLNRYRHPQINTVGLVAYYKLWAGLTSAANVFDYALKGFSGTPTGTDIAPAYPGFKFNGTDDYIDVGDISANANTIFLWFKSDTQIDNTSTSECLMQIGSLENETILVGASTVFLDNEIISVLNNDGGRSGYTSTTDVIAANEWHNLCCVWDGSKYLIYLDAVQKQNAVNATPSILTVDGLEIGRENDASGYFGGNLSDVMIFNVSKSAAEVKSLYELTKWRYPNN